MDKIIVEDKKMIDQLNFENTNKDSHLELIRSFVRAHNTIEIYGKYLRRYDLKDSKHEGEIYGIKTTDSLGNERWVEKTNGLIGVRENLGKTLVYDTKERIKIFVPSQEDIPRLLRKGDLEQEIAAEIKFMRENHWYIDLDYDDEDDYQFLREVAENILRINNFEKAVKNSKTICELIVNCHPGWFHGEFYSEIVGYAYEGFIVNNDRSFNIPKRDVGEFHGLMYKL